MNKNEAIRRQRELEQNLPEIKAVLLNIPDVVAVGIGYKESNNVFTKEIAYRVYVPAKKSLASLAPADVIPPEINGIKTDVLTPLRVTNDSDVCGNERRTLDHHRPLTAGIAISTDSNSYGTLGWFGTLTDGTTVLLTNKHVLYDATNTTDTRKLKTAQPQLGDPSKCCCCTCGSDNVIGEAIIGIRDITPASDTSVDCAIAKINADIAAEIDFSITNSATDEVLVVTGTGTAVVGDQVRKIGARSAFTRGEVVHLGDIAVEPATDEDGTEISVRQGQVLIVPIETETYEVREGVCKVAFSNSGDSGAVILNDDDEIIALNWGGDRTTNVVGITIANHIQNVLDKLSAAGFDVTLATSESDGDRGRHKQPRRALSLSEPNLLEKIRDANKQSLLYWLYEKHHQEIIRLINHCRPVTIAWQRNQGPAYVAAISRAARESTYQLPHNINEISRQTLLSRLSEVLSAHGSDVLQRDILHYKESLIACVMKGYSLEDLADGLKESAFLDVIPFKSFINSY